MGREQRRGPRVSASLNVTVILRDAQSSRPLAEPLMGSLKDVSRFGIRVLLSRIRSGEYHLFYAVTEGSSRLLIVEAIDPEEEGRLVVPVRPVWFDRILSDPARPFELGLEFLVGPNDPSVLRLHQLLAVPIRSGSGWLRRLFG